MYKHNLVGANYCTSTLYAHYLPNHYTDQTQQYTSLDSRLHAGDIYGLGVPTHTEQRHIFCDVLIMEELNSVDEVSE